MCSGGRGGVGVGLRSRTGGLGRAGGGKYNAIGYNAMSSQLAPILDQYDKTKKVGKAVDAIDDLTMTAGIVLH